MSLPLDAVIFVAGHRGMVGSAIQRRLAQAGYLHVLTAERDTLDLTEQEAVREFFAGQRIDAVVLAAAKVGGIHANASRPAVFLYDNLMIEANVIHAAHHAGVNDLLFLGSSCIYPREAVQPMPEEALLTGPLEPTNAAYALAKIAGIKLCESYSRQFGRSYRCLMPTNLYGPGDSFHAEDAHVIPALLRRFHEAVASGAAEVVIWGSGTPRREFLHVNDLAAACVRVMQLDDADWKALTGGDVAHVNVGSGEECTIADLARTIAQVVGYTGEIRFDAGRPDGTPRKLLDLTRIRRLGWAPTIGLEQGLRETYRWFAEQAGGVRGV